MTQEPWCWHPRDIASLTDFQIEHLLFRPAEKRAKELKGEKTDDGWKPDLSGLWNPDLTSREAFVTAMAAQVSRGYAQPQDFGLLWDQMKAKKDADRGNDSESPEPPARRPTDAADEPHAG